MQEELNTNVIIKKDMVHYNADPGEVVADFTETQAQAHERIQRRWADRFMSALQSEVCETREALTQDVKWWKDKTKPLPGVKEEMIDCLHFLMSGFLAVGMTAEEVYKIYCDKNKENFVRKDWDVNQTAV